MHEPSHSSYLLVATVIITVYAWFFKPDWVSDRARVYLALLLVIACPLLCFWGVRSDWNQAPDSSIVQLRHLGYHLYVEDSNFPPAKRTTAFTVGREIDRLQPSDGVEVPHIAFVGLSDDLSYGEEALTRLGDVQVYREDPDANVTTEADLNDELEIFIDLACKPGFDGFLVMTDKDEEVGDGDDAPVCGGIWLKDADIISFKNQLAPLPGGADFRIGINGDKLYVDKCGFEYDDKAPSYGLEGWRALSILDLAFHDRNACKPLPINPFHPGWVTPRGDGSYMVPLKSFILYSKTGKVLFVPLDEGIKINGVDPLLPSKGLAKKLDSEWVRLRLLKRYFRMKKDKLWEYKCDAEGFCQRILVGLSKYHLDINLPRAGKKRGLMIRSRQTPEIVSFRRGGYWLNFSEEIFNRNPSLTADSQPMRGTRPIKYSSKLQLAEPIEAEFFFEHPEKLKELEYHQSGELEDEAQGLWVISPEKITRFDFEKWFRLGDNHTYLMQALKITAFPNLIWWVLAFVVLHSLCFMPFLARAGRPAVIAIVVMDCLLVLRLLFGIKGMLFFPYTSEGVISALAGFLIGPVLLSLMLVTLKKRDPEIGPLVGAGTSIIIIYLIQSNLRLHQSGLSVVYTYLFYAAYALVPVFFFASLVVFLIGKSKTPSAESFFQRLLGFSGSEILLEIALVALAIGVITIPGEELLSMRKILIFMPLIAVTQAVYFSRILNSTPLAWPPSGIFMGLAAAPLAYSFIWGDSDNTTQAIGFGLILIIYWIIARIWAYKKEVKLDLVWRAFIALVPLMAFLKEDKGVALVFVPGALLIIALIMIRTYYSLRPFKTAHYLAAIACMIFFLFGSTIGGLSYFEGKYQEELPKVPNPNVGLDTRTGCPATTRASLERLGHMEIDTRGPQAFADVFAFSNIDVRIRELAVLDASQRVGTMEGARVAEAFAISRRYAQGYGEDGNPKGDGFLQDNIYPFSRSLVESQLTDTVLAVMVLPEWGLRGAIALILLYASLVALATIVLGKVEETTIPPESFPAKRKETSEADPDSSKPVTDPNELEDNQQTGWKQLRGASSNDNEQNSSGDAHSADNSPESNQGVNNQKTEEERIISWTTIFAGLSAAYFGVSGIYMIGANLEVLPFTGQNTPMLSIISGSDLLLGLIFLAAAALGEENKNNGDDK